MNLETKSKKNKGKQKEIDQNSKRITKPKMDTRSKSKKKNDIRNDKTTVNKKNKSSKHE